MQTADEAEPSEQPHPNLSDTIVAIDDSEFDRMIIEELLMNACIFQHDTEKTSPHGLIGYLFWKATCFYCLGYATDKRVLQSKNIANIPHVDIAMSE